MGWFKSLVIFILVFFSIFFCLVSYVSQDPIKSSFFLIFSLLGIVPLVSLGVYIWYSYFISLLFLSGVFVIVVYFSSISSYVKIGLPYGLFVFFLRALFFSVNFFDLGYFLGVNVFYFKVYVDLLIFVLLILLYFMNFSSYFMNFSGALRSL